MSDAEVAVPANYLQTRFVGLFHAVASKVFWAGFFWELFGECLADNKYHTAKYAFLTGLGEEPDHELYPNYQHERRLRRAAGESDEAWEKRMLAGSPTRRRRPPGAG